MHFLRVAFFIFSCLLVFPGSGFAFQGYVQPFTDGGSIAWGSGEISVVQAMEPAEGGEQASPLAVRRAASKARKTLLDMVLGVRVDSRQTIGAYLAGDDALSARVRGAIQNSPFQRPAMFDEAGEVRVSESLRGKLAELALPTTIQFQSGIPPRLSTSMEQSMNFSDGAPERVGGAGGYSGVIIDARGLKVTPALAPVIYGQDGVGAYGPFVVSRASAIEFGVCAYAATAEVSALHERVGDRPLTVRALKTYGSWGTDLVISSQMARLIRAIMIPGNIVDNCRVVIVVDEPVAPEEAVAPLLDAPADEVVPTEGQ